MLKPSTATDFEECWRGHWIWLAEEPYEPKGFWSAEIDSDAPESHALFRKTFHLVDLPARAPARITADSRYALYINGQQVLRGPVRSQPRRLYYDVVDLAPYLRLGKNILAAYVKYYGTANAFWLPAVPNNTLGQKGVLVFEGKLGEAGWLTSDATWKAFKTAAWDEDWAKRTGHHTGVPLELFDARQLAHNWFEATFDDHLWNAAVTIPATHVGGFARTQPPSDPYGRLLPRPIATLTGALKQPASVRASTLKAQLELSSDSPVERIHYAFGQPASAPQGVSLPLTFSPEHGAQCLTLDMGGIISGLVGFELEAAAGTVVDISYTETPLQASFSMDKMQAGSRYIARGDHDAFRLFESTGFRYAYILVHGPAGTVTFKRFDVQEQLYPWQGDVSFSCNDSSLQRIFDAGVRTVELCSHDAFIDCPTREQRAWVGDAVVHQMVHLATNNDWRLAWHFLTLADSPRYDGLLPMSVAGDIELRGSYTIPDWSLHWAHGVYNLYRFAGDQKSVARFMPTFERILRWYEPYQNAQGLLTDVPEWNLIDWSSVSTEGTSALVTALWARGLLEFAEIAAWLEQKHSQRWAEHLYGHVKANFEVFWNEARGSYVDHLVGGVQQPEMSQLAGALAIVSRLAPAARWDRIIDTITDPEWLVVRSWLADSEGQQSLEKWQRQVRLGRYDIDWDVYRDVVHAQPFMSYVVHDAVALAGRAEQLIDLYRRWSYFLRDGYDTIGECWDFGTKVHGWSCTPSRDFVFYTLGVTPLAPGYAQARIAPRLGSLSWIKGRVPTPYGVIAVEVTPESVRVDSPVPFELDLKGQLPQNVLAGNHRFAHQV